MPVNDQIQSTGNVIKAVGALVALFPGIGYLLGIVDLPSSMVKTITIVSFSVSAIVVIAVFQLTAWLQALSNRRAIAYSVSAVLIGGMLVIAYSEFAESYIVHIPVPEGQESRFAIPIHPTADFLLDLDPATPGHPETVDYQHRLSGGADPAAFKVALFEASRETRYAIYLLLLLSQVLLIAPVVAAAWKLASAVSEPLAPSSSAPGNRRSGKVAVRKGGSRGMEKPGGSRP